MLLNLSAAELSDAGLGEEWGREGAQVGTASSSRRLPFSTSTLNPNRDHDPTPRLSPLPNPDPNAGLGEGWGAQGGAAPTSRRWPL